MLVNIAMRTPADVCRGLEATISLCVQVVTRIHDTGSARRQINASAIDLSLPIDGKE